MHYIQTELETFRRSHQHAFNLLFHILCGVVYMTCVMMLFGKYKFYVLLGYALMLMVSGVGIGVSATAALFIWLAIHLNIRLDTYPLIAIIFITYFLPELSHILTGEQTVLTNQNISIPTIILNFFGLLPFSIYSLFSIYPARARRTTGVYAT